MSTSIGTYRLKKGPFLDGFSGVANGNFLMKEKDVEMPRKGGRRHRRRHSHSEIHLLPFCRASFQLIV